MTARQELINELVQESKKRGNLPFDALSWNEFVEARADKLGDRTMGYYLSISDKAYFRLIATVKRKFKESK